MRWRTVVAWTWTRSQRQVLATIVGAMLLVIVWRAATDGAHLQDPPQSNPHRAAYLADRIDLNTAEIESLVTLPGIGPARAEAIVAYRSRSASGSDRRPAFTKPEDLLYIDGFGVAMIEQLRPHLIFPAAPGDPADGTP